MKNIITSTILLFVLVSCNVKPQDISYGEQSCQFCRMTIVDRQHAAQFVNDKGKAFNFDAAECMINYLQEIDKESIGLLLVSDYNAPETLIDVNHATFIISEEIPSPMGANLSAVAKSEEANALLKNKTGQIYTWKELLNHLNDL